MENSDDTDLVTAFKKILAENKSLQARQEESAAIIASRDNKIAMLQTMLSEADEYRSSTDNRLEQLDELQFYINDLKQQVAGTVYMAVGRQQQTGVNSAGVDQQLEELRKDYAALQSQLAGMQVQLQQQGSRVAELESLLANTGPDRH